MGGSYRPVSAAPLQAEAEVVHSIQILAWQGVIPQLPEVLGPQVLASISCHGVVTLEEQGGGQTHPQILVQWDLTLRMSLLTIFSG